MKALGPLAVILAMGMWATVASADGGAVLLHKDAGPFTVTMFAAPQPLTTGVADLSVMVQDRASGDVLLDPLIDVSAVLVETGLTQQSVRLAPANSGNRLLQSASMHFSRPGRWRLNVLVRRGSDVAQVSTECIVQPDTSRVAIVWFYVLLPVGVILIFLLHQALKQKQSKSLRDG